MTGLSVVIVNYNTGTLVRKSLDSVWPQLPPKCEVFVVDNASTDGSADGLEAAFPGLRLIRNVQNDGYARANNQALRLARGRYALLLNPDVTVEPGALAAALAYLEAQPDVGIVGPRILRPDGRLDPPARRTFKTPGTYLYKMLGLSRLFPRHRRFGRYYLSYLDEMATTDVDSVVGAFLLIRREVIERVGLLDERFFMYCEDEDWCWRTKQAGWRVVYYPEAVVHHRRGSSTAKHPFRMAYHRHRSYVLYHRKNIAPRYPGIVNAAVYAGIGLGMGAAIGRAGTARLLSPVASVASSGSPFRRLFRYLARPDVRRDPIRLLGRRLVFEFMSRFSPYRLLTEREVTFDGDLRMRIRLKDSLERSMYVHGIYEQRTTAAFCGLLWQGMTVLDVGSYIGLFTLLAAKRVGPSGRVLAVEPNPDSHARLVRNIQLNGFRNVTALSVALSDVRGAAALHVPLDDACGATLSTLRVATADLPVPVETLDALLTTADATRIDLIKVDVEGLEERVLKGGEQTIRRWHPLVIFEANDFLYDASKTTNAAVDFLRELGYRLYGIEGGNGQLGIIELMPGDDPRPYREPGMSLNLIARHREQPEGELQWKVAA